MTDRITKEPEIVVQPTTAAAAKPPFDAAAHMRKIRTKQGMQDYLDVKWRLLWLRSEHPDASVVTQIIEQDEQHAIIHASISFYVADRVVMATAHGTETRQDFPGPWEKAETKAVGRACAVLGYGTDAASDFDDGEPMDGRAAAREERVDRGVRQPTAPRPDRVTMNDEMIPAAQTWFTNNLPRRGFAVPKTFTKWGDVLGVLTKNKINTDAVVDERGIDYGQLKVLVEDLPVVETAATVAGGK